MALKDIFKALCLAECITSILLAQYSNSTASMSINYFLDFVYILTAKKHLDVGRSMS